MFRIEESVFRMIWATFSVATMNKCGTHMTNQGYQKPQNVDNYCLIFNEFGVLSSYLLRSPGFCWLVNCHTMCAFVSFNDSMVCYFQIPVGQPIHL